MSEWISVKDRLPDQDDTYIVVVSYSLFGKRSRWTKAMPFDTEVGFYYEVEQVDDTYRREVDDTVTHWMPLPEPPKEG